MPNLLNVSGAARTSLEFRDAFSRMVERHDWDGDAIAAVISNESGFNPAAKNPEPGQSAVGLLQFIKSTLEMLGFHGTRDEFAALTDTQQLPFVEDYFARAVGDGKHRPVDYYLANWGAPAGLPMDHVLASQGENSYELNKGLDKDHDGKIEVADLDSVIQGKISSARGLRVPGGAPGKASGGAAPQPSPPSSQCLLPELRLGSVGPAVSLLRGLLERFEPASMLMPGDKFDQPTLGALKMVQGALGLTPDGVVGAKTWGALASRLFEPPMPGYR